MHEIGYTPDGDTLRRFLLERALVKLIQGPYGSGKTVGTIFGFIKNAHSQTADPQGERWYRIGIVRRQSTDLKRTTMESYTAWFPPAHFGKVKISPPMEHRFRLALPDGTFLNYHADFFALDDAGDVERLGSYECTDLWFNEFREIDKAMIDAGTGRVGRFPSMGKVPGGAVNPTIWGDTNPPDEDHWFAVMSGQVAPPEFWDEDMRKAMQRPDNWRIYLQPPGMLEVFGDDGKVTGYVDNANAENVKNLRPGYYRDQIGGKKRVWIEKYILNRARTERSGRPVQSGYNPDLHRATKPLPVFASLPVYVGLDFGLTPAAVFFQIVGGRTFIQREIAMTRGSAKSLAREIKRVQAENYPECRKWIITGDPAGNGGAQTDETTPFMILASEGILAHPAETNDMEIRVQVVDNLFAQLDPISGQPALQLDPSCVMLHTGWLGAYSYPRVMSFGKPTYAITPEKNPYSHPCEAAQYALLGSGAGRGLQKSRVARPRRPGRPANARRGDYDVFSRAMTPRRRA